MKNEISLNGVWSLTFYPEHAPGEKTVISASVPGNVELDLAAAGIEDEQIYYGLNTLKFRKYEFYAWRFEREFELPECFTGKDIILRFDGIDTYGTVFVNGAKAGCADNMLIPHEYDVTGLVRPGVNTVAVHISSAVNKARGDYYPAGLSTWEDLTDEYITVRKPAHSFGWDISARLLSAGLWRGVSLYAREKTYIKEAYYFTNEADNGSASLTLRYRFETDDPYLEGFSVKVTGVCGGSVFEASSPAIFVSNKLFITIDKPKLWWPAGYGEPHLYKTVFTLLHHGEVVDTREEFIGIRTVKVDRRYGGPDYGEFKFIVNNTPIMVRGTNWVHLDCLHSRDAVRLPEAHALLRDINCNMVRMWGGNVYESDEFYDLCDKYGILVWQDFSLACALYSQYGSFADVMDAEAASVIIRLRNHPCIALWAGDNEIDAAYASMGHAFPHGRHNRLSRDTLPGAVMTHDPAREYLRSSPMIEGDYPDDTQMPEQHNYGPRDFYKGDFNRLCKAHFVSEMSYHGCNAVSSLRQFIPEDELWPYSEKSMSWKLHSSEYITGHKRGYDRNVLMFNQVRVLFGGIPEDLPDFVLASQISQAEALKFFIENIRIQKWRRSGLLWWNLLDGWPQTSDAVVDYYFRKKLAYYYIKRAQQPVHMILGESEGWRHKVCLCNDTLHDREVAYSITDYGKRCVVLEGSVFAPGNENVFLPDIPSIPGERKLYLLHWETEGEKYASHYVSGFPPFDLGQYKEWLKAIQEICDPFEPEIL